MKLLTVTTPDLCLYKIYTLAVQVPLSPPLENDPREVSGVDLGGFSPLELAGPNKMSVLVSFNCTRGALLIHFHTY